MRALHQYGLPSTNIQLSTKDKKLTGVYVQRSQRIANPLKVNTFWLVFYCFFRWSGVLWIVLGFFGFFWVFGLFWGSLGCSGSFSWLLRFNERPSDLVNRQLAKWTNEISVKLLVHLTPEISWLSGRFNKIHRLVLINCHFLIFTSIH